MKTSQFCRYRLADPLQSYNNAVAINPQNAKSSRGGPQSRSVSDHGRLWLPGSTLTISFLGNPDPDLKKAIQDLAVKWLPHGNLQFQFTSNNNGDADIRISTPDSGLSSSAVGTDARLYNPDESMILAIRPNYGVYFESTVLHEFGHALGLLHEHQHPQAMIPWDRDKLIAKFQGTDLTAEVIESNFLTRLNPTGLLVLDYDPLSVMHYEVFADETDGVFEIGLNYELSDKDKEFMRTAYPY